MKDHLSASKSNIPTLPPFSLSISISTTPEQQQQQQQTRKQNISIINEENGNCCNDDNDEDETGKTENKRILNGKEQSDNIMDYDVVGPNGDGGLQQQQQSQLEPIVGVGKMPERRKKKPYKELTLEEKVQLIRLAERCTNLSQANIAERYEIAKSNVCRILQRKDEYLQAMESASFSGSRKRKLRAGNPGGELLLQQKREEGGAGGRGEGAENDALLMMAPTIKMPTTEPIVVGREEGNERVGNGLMMIRRRRKREEEKEFVEDSETLRAHMAAEHQTGRVFLCRCCNWAFQDKNELHRHLKTRRRMGDKSTAAVRSEMNNNNVENVKKEESVKKIMPPLITNGIIQGNNDEDGGGEEQGGNNLMMMMDGGIGGGHAAANNSGGDGDGTFVIPFPLTMNLIEQMQQRQQRTSLALASLSQFDTGGNIHHQQQQQQFLVASLWNNLMLSQYSHANFGTTTSNGNANSVDGVVVVNGSGQDGAGKGQPELRPAESEINLTACPASPSPLPESQPNRPPVVFAPQPPTTRPLAPSSLPSSSLPPSVIVQNNSNNNKNNNQKSANANFSSHFLSSASLLPAESTTIALISSFGSSTSDVSDNHNNSNNNNIIHQCPPDNAGLVEDNEGLSPLASSHTSSASNSNHHHHQNNNNGNNSQTMSPSQLSSSSSISSTSLSLMGLSALQQNNCGLANANSLLDLTPASSGSDNAPPPLAHQQPSAFVECCSQCLLLKSRLSLAQARSSYLEIYNTTFQNELVRLNAKCMLAEQCIRRLEMELREWRQRNDLFRFRLLECRDKTLSLVQSGMNSNGIGTGGGGHLDLNKFVGEMLKITLVE